MFCTRNSVAICSKLFAQDFDGKRLGFVGRICDERVCQRVVKLVDTMQHRDDELLFPLRSAGQEQFSGGDGHVETATDPPRNCPSKNVGQIRVTFAVLSSVLAYP